MVRKAESGKDDNRGRPAGPMRNETFLREVLDNFRRSNPEVAKAMADSKGEDFRTRVHLVVSYPKGEVWLCLKDKDDHSMEMPLVTKDTSLMVVICNLLRKGMTFRELREKGVFKPMGHPGEKEG